MSSAVFFERVTEASPRFKARIAGVFWLLCALTGSFALVVIGRFVGSGDGAATVANILANQASYRLGLAANILATVCYVAATLLVYDLLKPVNRNVSLLAAFFSLLGCAGGTVTFFFQLAPLVVLGRIANLSAFTTEQLQAQAQTFLALGSQASNINFVFFGLHCLLVGWLIFQSTFLPRIVGALMMLAGLGWLTLSLTSVLALPLGRSLSPYLMAAGGLGEMSLTLWLLVMGVNVQRWNERAGAAGEES